MQKSIIKDLSKNKFFVKSVSKLIEYVEIERRSVPDVGNDVLKVSINHRQKLL